MDMEKFAAAFILLLNAKKKEKQKCKRSCWIKPYIKRRPQLGACSLLTREHQIEDAQQFRNFVRMTAVQMQHIIELVGPLISRQNTKMRKAISAYERVVITLRFLATGDSYTSLHHVFRVPVCTIGRIVKEVTPAIYNVLKNKYLKFPSSADDWLQLANTFEERWNFPHCLGAIDGKHVVIQASANSGSEYYNYQGSHSIVLIAAVDGNYNFTYVDVGCFGSDNRVFENCKLYKQLEEGTLNLPENSALPSRNVKVPYVFVADDEFPTNPFTLKPYPNNDQVPFQRIFNYRHSKAQSIVENVLGIAAHRFRVLRRPINLSPNIVTDIVLAICTLHNFLMATEDSNYFNEGMFDMEDTEMHEIIEGSWRDDESLNNLLPLQRESEHIYCSSQEVRDEFKEYFMTTSDKLM